MTFVPVDELPKTNRGRKVGDDFSEYHHYKNELDSFIKMNARIVKVNYLTNEFASYRSAYKSLYDAIKRAGYPINAHVRNGEVYLVRRDI